MPRVSRTVLPGYPHHVVHRGHNKHPLFVEDRDFLFYARLLREWKSHLGCKVYAFCLMTNHVHIVVDPGDDPDNLGRLMKRLAGRYTRYVNRLENRSGTAWNGRFKSNPVDTDRYLLACCRYVELNPVRAGIVGSPGDYPWSSYRSRIDSSVYPWVDELPFGETFGETGSESNARYCAWIGDTVPKRELETIRRTVARGHPLGGSRFRSLIEQRLGRRIEIRGPGRPRKSENESKK